MLEDVLVGKNPKEELEEIGSCVTEAPRTEEAAEGIIVIGASVIEERFARSVESDEKFVDAPVAVGKVVVFDAGGVVVVPFQ